MYADSMCLLFFWGGVLRTSIFKGRDRWGSPRLHFLKNSVHACQQLCAVLGWRFILVSGFTAMRETRGSSATHEHPLWLCISAFAPGRTPRAQTRPRAVAYAWRRDSGISFSSGTLCRGGWRKTGAVVGPGYAVIPPPRRAQATCDRQSSATPPPPFEWDGRNSGAGEAQARGVATSQ